VLDSILNLEKIAVDWFSGEEKKGDYFSAPLASDEKRKDSLTVRSSPVQRRPQKGSGILTRRNPANLFVLDPKAVCPWRQHSNLDYREGRVASHRGFRRKGEGFGLQRKGP